MKPGFQPAPFQSNIHSVFGGQPRPVDARFGGPSYMPVGAPATAMADDATDYDVRPDRMRDKDDHQQGFMECDEPPAGREPVPRRCPRIVATPTSRTRR
jgi:hypothetical protein